jgi:tyrosine-specific transport protein
MRISRFWYGVATLVGSTIGIGMYGIPYVFAQASFGVGLLWLVVIASIVLLWNLAYGEIVLRTHARHQFIGYVDTYLGSGLRRLAAVNFWISVYGSLVGTIIVSGTFLDTILGSVLPFSSFFYSSLFVMIGALFILSGLRMVARVDFFVMCIAIAVVWGIGVFAGPFVESTHYTFHFGSTWFLPFGVLLFATNGIFGVPLMRELMVGQERNLKKAITFGTIIPVILYGIFAFVVVGVSGLRTSQEAFAGLAGFVGPMVLIVGSAFGFLTSSTIFLNMSTAFRQSLHEDFKLKSYWSFILVILLPYLLFALGIRDFISVIGLVGGVGIAIDMMLIFLTYIQARKHGTRKPEFLLIQ